MKSSRFDLRRLDFSTRDGLVVSSAALKPTQFGLAIGQAFQQSQGDALKLTGALLSPGNAFANSLHLAKWAGGLSPAQAPLRRTVIRAFREQGQELVLVHRMAALGAAQARTFVNDYLAEGGSVAALVEWLQLAGKALRAKVGGGRTRAARPRRTARASGRRGQRGFFDDVWNAVTSAGSALVNWITNLADAVIDGAKSLASAVAEVAAKAVGDIADFIEALVQAGRSLASILSEAVKKGVATLEKFVQAALEAGRSLAEIIGWAASQVASTVKSVVNKLLRLGKRLADIVGAAVAKGAAALRAVGRALAELGQAVASILAAVANQALSVVQSVIQGLLDAGKAVRDILVAAAGQAVAFLRNAVQALVNLGRSVADILAAVASQAAAVVNAVVAALIQIGRRISEVLQWALAQARAVAKAIVSALLQAGRTLLDLLREAWQFVRSAFRALLQALLDLGTRVGQILDAIARNLLDAARTVLEGLLQIGIRLADVVKSILTDILAAARKGFFEALVAIGQAPLKVLQAAAEAGGSLLFLAITVFFEIWGGYRGLTAAERREAGRVFGASIDLDRVKIAAGNVPAEVANYINGRTPFTTMYLINFSKQDSQRTDEDFLRTLIHEMTHVWQGVQAGPLYMLESVCSQFKAVLSGGDRNKAYDYTEQDLVRNNGDFSKFNREQQAAIVEDYWVLRFSTTLVKTGIPPLNLLQTYASQVFRAARRLARSTSAARPARRRVRLATA